MDSLNLKNFLYPLICHKHSFTSSAFVVTWAVELVPGVLALDCAAVATTYLVSWMQQTSTFLQDSVSTTSQTLPLRVFTLSVPTLNFLRCLLDSPQWPDPASHTWLEAKPETLPTELWCLLAPPNSVPIFSACHVRFWYNCFLWDRLS